APPGARGRAPRPEDPPPPRPPRPPQQPRRAPALRTPRLRGRGRPPGSVPAGRRLRRRPADGAGLEPVTVVGIDVGGERKGFHGCALDGARIVAGPQALGGV